MAEIKTEFNGIVDWINIQNIESKRFTCGYCNERISSKEGYNATYQPIVNGKIHAKNFFGYIYICHSCGKPNFIDKSGVTHPGSSFGKEVNHIPSTEVRELYKEARDCMKVNAYTSSVMCCRKLLMNIAVTQSAEKNKKFTEYVDYLELNHFTPPNSSDWVDQIRKKGNLANHEIQTMTREDAEQLITFSEMLLKFIYEFPGMTKQDSEVDEGDESLEIA